MKPATHASALRVQAALGERFTVLEFDRSTRTAAEAAAAVGCTVAQIAKSIVFRADSGRAVLVIASGSNRVDERKVAALLGEGIGRADAEFVRAETGFAIGGVPPVGHDRPPIVFIDRDLEALGTLWAAAGTPNAVFALSWNDLRALTNGRVGDVALTELVAPTPGPRPQADDRRN
jgi:prolyl-tRNA editing enzyme YbaK/EbsC (Cys-tRNA(Pro) deacylase)